jgi:hypothetical protein
VLTAIGLPGITGDSQTLRIWLALTLPELSSCWTTGTLSVKPTWQVPLAIASRDASWAPAKTGLTPLVGLTPAFCSP